MSSIPHSESQQSPGAGAGPPAPNVVPTREGYDRWSQVYDVHTNPLILLEEPVMQALIGDVRGMDVLDVGCGTGRWSLRLAEGGARVTGIDFSQGMLARAREKPGAAGIRFLAHDLHALFPFGSATFDRVVCALVLDHIRDLRRFFDEMGRVCRGDGAIVVSTMHPAMMLRGVQARFTDPATGAKLHVDSASNQISDFVMGACAAGLTIEHIAEYAMDETTAGGHERARAYIGWPMLLTMRLRPARSR